jgi:hypothetical protein
MGRRVPSLATYAKLRQGLGLDVPPTVLMAPRPVAQIADDHLTALAACVVSRHGGPLTDLAAALKLTVPAVREGVLRIADRLAAVGFQVVDDSVEVRLLPRPQPPPLSTGSAPSTYFRSCLRSTWRPSAPLPIKGPPPVARSSTCSGVPTANSSSGGSSSVDWRRR